MFDWKKEQGLAQRDLASILQITPDFDQNIKLIRSNYKQGVWTLWLSSPNNTEIATLISKLSAAGWKEPSLLEYTYTPTQINLCLRVRR